MKRAIVFLLCILMMITMSSCAGQLNINGDIGKAFGSESGGSASGEITGVHAEPQDDLINTTVKIQPSKQEFGVDEQIEVRLTITDEKIIKTAVIVIVDSDVPHSNETSVHDDYLEYRYVRDFDSDIIRLTALRRVGSYDVRVYKDNNGGAELASVTINVVG